MSFAKRRKSTIKTKKRNLFPFLNAVIVCLLGLTGMSEIASAQGVSGLNTPQKQTITFTFGLGSAELTQKYGQNAASSAKFDKLIGQVADTPSARIDSIVITSYSSTADQIGDAELAGRRIQAVRNYVGPVIRQSQLKQTVVITGNVVAKNNLFQPEQVFDLLKKTTVTVYMNGISAAKISGGQRTGFSGDEEAQRYASPFGGSSDVFARKPAKSTNRVSEQPSAPKEEEVQVVPIQPVVGVVAEKNTTQKDDLRKYIDSLTATSSAALPKAPETTPVVKVPEVTEEEPCPQGRDPEIDDLIAKLLASESSAQKVTPEVSVEAVPVVPVAPIGGQNAESVEPKATTDDRDTWGGTVIPFPKMAEDAFSGKMKVKEARGESKMKTVKEPRVPMALIHPFMGIKTNLVYWAAVAANVELEFYFAKRWSAAVEGVYTNWDMNLYKKHYAVNEISPEIRFWTGKKHGQYRGFYVGVYGHAGQFDIMFRNQETGYTGEYYGGGIAIGGYLPFTPHFGMELGLRGGYVNAKYDTYYYDAPFYMHKCSKETGYFGLTGAKISLVYRFGLRGANRK